MKSASFRYLVIVSASQGRLSVGESEVGWVHCGTEGQYRLENHFSLLSMGENTHDDDDDDEIGWWRSTD